VDQHRQRPNVIGQFLASVCLRTPPKVSSSTTVRLMAGVNVSVGPSAFRRGSLRSQLTLTPVPVAYVGVRPSPLTRRLSGESERRAR